MSSVRLTSVAVICGTSMGFLPVLLAGCECHKPGTVALDTGTTARRTLESRVDASLRQAVDYLAATQCADGAWRSKVYATFKVGDALTPAVLAAFAALPDEFRPPEAWERGHAYLAEMVDEHGTIVSPREGVAYPVYSAACALFALAERGESANPAREAWVRYLRARQLDEANGWDPTDVAYGGWGYATDQPRKPAGAVPLGPLLEPNLSATAYALGALRIAGVAADDAAILRGQRFVERCQNHAADSGNSQLDDGGFIFVLDDPVRNKAGLALSAEHDRRRYRSYGSATADGLRCYLACGLANDDLRLQAAWRWMAANFSATEHPGNFDALQQSTRNSVYFYYVHGLAEVLVAAGQDLPPAIDSRGWAAAMAEALMARQQPDGRWENADVEVRENDPLVATSLALRALALCRRMIVVESSAALGAFLRDDRPEPANSPVDQGR